VTKRPTQTDDEQQRQVAELLRSFDAEPAPARLHRRVEALVAEHDKGPARASAERREPRSAGRTSSRRPFAVPRFAGVGAVAAVAVVVVVALAVVLGGNGGAHTPSLRQAAAPTLSAATLPAPPESSTDRARLVAAVDGVPFPYWSERFGWRSTGSRTDRVDGRSITTVFYADSSGRRIGYAILAGTPAPRVSGGVIAWRGGVPYRILTENGAAVVTWLRDGRLCVVSGRGVSSATLLKLAGWSDHDATAS
jgi:hypothetical protein